MLLYEEQKRMGKDRFHAPTGSLSFSTETVSLTLSPGEQREGSFTIYAHADDSVNGFVLSSRLSMRCLTSSFAGSKEVISFRFDAAPFQTGDTVEGYFRIISNEGEYKLPFKVKIMPSLIQSSLGPVRNLFHFTNLAKTNWKEAAAAFYSPDFEEVFTASEGKEKVLWRGLSAKKGNQQNMEEFLISIGKKQAVQFIPAVQEISVNVPVPEKGELVQTLDIKRNGWGYTKLEAASEGTFIRLSQNVMTALDFREGTFSFIWSIDPKGLHAGLNLGTIILKAPFEEMRIPVEVRYCVSTALRTIQRMEMHETIFGMTKDYENFRARKISGKEYLSRTGSYIRKLTELDPNGPYTTLYRIHYLLTARRTDEGKYELQQYNRKLAGDVEKLPAYSIAQFPSEDDTAYAYRMYLTILCVEAAEEDAAVVVDTTSGAERVIRDMLKRNPDNFWIAWLYMYASGDVESRPADSWQMLKEQSDYGCNSPILYLEAYSLIHANPAILHELSEFELQTLLYAAKHGQLDSAVMAQVNYLAQRKKDFSAKLLRILEAGYEIPDGNTFRDETLSSICTILIRGNLTDEKYFVWYQRGVERQLSITRLFDYYMLSMPESYRGEIPQMIILYFAFQSTLPYEQNAMLYRYIVENREKYARVYSQYSAQIRDFTEEEIFQHRISDSLAYLYEFRIQDREHPLNNELAGACVPEAFTCKVKTDDPKAKRIVLIYTKCRTEQYFPVKDGACYLPVYGKDYQLFFEDDRGGRYASSISYTITRLMDYREDARILSSYETSNFYYDLYLSGMKDSWYKIGGENASHYRRLSESDELLEKYRQEYRLLLLHYYHESDAVREMDDFLDKVEPTELSPEARSEITGYMVIRGKNEKALQWIRKYGAFNVDPAILMKLCSAVLKGQQQKQEDPDFAEIVHECFLKGKYDEAMLLYMESDFDGLTEELEEIRKAAADFGADEGPIAKRMLVQILYTGHVTAERDELVVRCIRDGEDTEFLANCLAQSSHFYFVQDLFMGKEQFDVITTYGREGVPIVDICRIAWLKDRAERSGSMKDAEREVTQLFLQDLMAEGIIFPFFRQFVGIYPQLQSYADETLVEYRAREYDRNAKIVYHYAMEKNGVRQQYRTREMKEMYEGVYVAGFLLFFGEQLQYYITNDPEKKNVVESGTQGQDARIPDDVDDRFGMINRISMLTALGRDEEALDRIEKYAHRAYLSDRLFGMQGEGQDAEHENP